MKLLKVDNPRFSFFCPLALFFPLFLLFYLLSCTGVLWHFEKRNLIIRCLNPWCLSRVFASHQSRSASFSCGTMLWLQRLKAKWEIISSQHGLWSQGAFANCWLLHISLCAPDFSSSTDKTNEKLKYKRESSIRNRVFFNWDTNIDHILPLCTYKDIHLYINGLQCVLFALVILFWQSQVSRSSYFLTFNCRVSIYIWTRYT